MNTRNDSACNIIGSINRKEEQYETRRRQLLDIGLRHFVQYGYYGTSTRKIAQEAGISSGLMFHYYPNKLALYEALVEIGCNVMLTESEEEYPPLVFFEKQLEWYLSIAMSDSFASRMFVFMGMASINAKDISESAYEHIKKHDVEAISIPYIEKGQKEGVIRDGDPRTLATVFYSSIQGFAEILNTKPDIKLPEKDWFMAILKK